MIEARRGFGLALGAVLLWACAGADGGEPLDVGVTGAALSACGEMVPENRYIDGIPAYAQCDATQSSAIFSNNGVDTATTAQGPDWVRTQYSGGYQCTELANRYLRFKWNVTWIPRGNAGQWCDTMPPANSGLVQTMTPTHGDIMVLAGGSCGAAQSTGHVTVVDIVDTAKGRLTVVEQNGARRGTYMQSCAKCFLHVVANDGTNPGMPIEPGTGAPVPTAGAPAAAGSPAGAPGTAGAAAPPSGRPGRAGSPAIQPPPPAAMPPAAAGAPAAGPAGSAAPLAPLPPAAPSAAGSRAVAGSAAPVVNVPTTPRERAGAEEASGCSVPAGTAAGHSQPSAAGFGLALGVAGMMWMRRRARRERRRGSDR